MAVLRVFRNSTVWENNIVQTVASAAGTLSSVIFVLPGLLMVGWWTGFPFGRPSGLCAIGGVLGVMYTIPLRRALVTFIPACLTLRVWPPPRCSRSAWLRARRPTPQAKDRKVCWP